jgi:hypothetical protein
LTPDCHRRPQTYAKCGLRMQQPGTGHRKWLKGAICQPSLQNQLENTPTGHRADLRGEPPRARPIDSRRDWSHFTNQLLPEVSVISERAAVSRIDIGPRPAPRPNPQKAD